MRPRLLLNENMPIPAARRLRAAGWEVLHIAEQYASVTDEAVMALACAEARWLITFDRDYGELVFQQQLPPPPLILLLRVASYQPEEPARWVKDLYASGALLEGHFCVFDGETLRRRPLANKPSRAH
jgi:predicted nuclease of predicted toxin-antitoxin system